MSEKIRRFTISYSVAFLLALTWPLALFWSFRDCPADALIWIKHEMTYGVVHHVFFPFAIGCFFAQFKLGDFVRSKWQKICFAFLIVIMVVASISSISSGYLQSYELKNPCVATENNRRLIEEREKIERKKLEIAELAYIGAPYEELKKLRDESKELELEFANSLTAFQNDRLKKGFKTIHKLNYLTFLNIFLSAFFQLFCVLVVWSLISLIWDRRLDDDKRQHLITVALLLIFWIPARAYANYFEREFGLVPVQDSPVIFGSVITIIFFAALFVDQLFSRGISREAAKFLGGVSLAAIAFMVSVFPEFAGTVYDHINNLPVEMVIVIGIVAIMMSIVVMRRSVEQDRVGEEND